jgi:hypothetical protein
MPLESNALYCQIPYQESDDKGESKNEWCNCL